MTGSGVGLAICKQLIDLMDGSIQCDSAPGQGTTFTVTLDLPIADHVGEDVSSIVTSAYAPEDVREEALNASANGFISKIFLRSTVYQNMSEILGLVEKTSSANWQDAERFKA